MLGIVLELHNPGIAVVAEHQMALRAAAHSSGSAAWPESPRLLRISHANCTALRSELFFAHGQRHGHGHDAVVVFAGLGLGPPVGLAHKAAALPQQPLAREELSGVSTSAAPSFPSICGPREGRRQPTVPLLLLKNPIVAAGAAQMRQHRLALIVALHGEQRAVVFPRQGGRFPGGLKRGQPSSATPRTAGPTEGRSPASP